MSAAGRGVGGGSMSHAFMKSFTRNAAVAVKTKFSKQLRSFASSAFSGSYAFTTLNCTEVMCFLSLVGLYSALTTSKSYFPIGTVPPTVSQLILSS